MSHYIQKRGYPEVGTRRLITKVEFDKTRHLGMKRTYFIGNYIEWNGICLFKRARGQYYILENVFAKCSQHSSRDEVIRILKEYWKR
jgi:hypothetical protein